MAYTRNEPVAGDDLDVSQPKLAVNTNGADDSFGVEHYKFSDLTASNGFHNQVTTPAYGPGSPTPPVTITNPIFYAFEQTASVGTLQFSRGTNNAVPSPLTTLQSVATPIILLNNGSTLLMDFAGLARAYVMIYAGDYSQPYLVFPTLQAVLWNGTSFIGQNYSANNFGAVASGTTLVLTNNTGSTLSNVYWTMQIVRLQ